MLPGFRGNSAQYPRNNVYDPVQYTHDYQDEVDDADEPEEQ